MVALPISSALLHAFLTHAASVTSVSRFRHKAVMSCVVSGVEMRERAKHVSYGMISLYTFHHGWRL